MRNLLHLERIRIRDQGEDLVKVLGQIPVLVAVELGPQLLAVRQGLLQELSHDRAADPVTILRVHTLTPICGFVRLLHFCIFAMVQPLLGSEAFPFHIRVAFEPDILLGIFPDHLNELAAAESEVDLLVVLQDLGIIRVGALKSLVDVTLQDCPTDF